MSAVKKGEKEEIKLQSSLINAHWYSKKGDTCQCTCQLVTKLSNKFNFFPGHRDGFWENVVVNLAMAKKWFERLLIHKFVNDKQTYEKLKRYPTPALRNVSHHYRQQSFSGLHSPGRLKYTITCLFVSQDMWWGALLWGNFLFRFPLTSLKISAEWKFHLQFKKPHNFRLR